MRLTTVQLRSLPPGSRPGEQCLPRARVNATRQATNRTVGRHPTGRDVLLGEKCTSTTPDMPQRTRETRDRSPGHIANHTEANAADDESPHSIFWVSQVYP